MIKKTKLGRDTLVSTIMTLITVLTWIGFSVYHVLTETTIAKVTQEQMKPLNHQIKKEIIERLKTNLSLSNEELNSTPLVTETEETEEAEMETSGTDIEPPISQPTTTSEKENSSS